jgi:hypothetical protein
LTEKLEAINDLRDEISFDLQNGWNPFIDKKRENDYNPYLQKTFGNKVSKRTKKRNPLTKQKLFEKYYFK